MTSFRFAQRARRRQETVDQIWFDFHTILGMMTWGEGTAAMPKYELAVTNLQMPAVLTGLRTQVAVQLTLTRRTRVCRARPCVFLRCSCEGEGAKKEEEEFGADMMASARRLELARRRLHQRRAAGTALLSYSYSYSYISWLVEGLESCRTIGPSIARLSPPLLAFARRGLGFG